MSTQSTTSNAPLPKWWSEKGELQRAPSFFRSAISREPGSQFPPEKERYHLYVSYACPWAQRVLITRKLKGLEDILPFTCVHYHMSLETGWRFATKSEDLPGDNVTPDPLHPDVERLRDLYMKADPHYEGRWTVPVLWDKKTNTIVSNESSEIIRMLYTEFDDLLPDQYRQIDLYPTSLRKHIDETNEWTYDYINNGVYKCGFAKTQEAYDTAVIALFTHLDRVEEHLLRTTTTATSPGPYYNGAHLTESDIRLYVTLIRFDVVYVQHFKCNIRDVRSGYPALHRWLRTMYWDVPAFRETTDFEHIKKHYMMSHPMINPQGIVCAGPVPHILPKDQEVVAASRALN